MERAVDDFIRRRNERAAATSSPLDPPAGEGQRRADTPRAHTAGQDSDPVAAYIAERNRRGDEAPNPLKDLPAAR